MNPLIRKKLDQIQSLVEEMGEVLRSNDAEVKKQHAEKEALLQKEWKRQKELTTLNRIAEDYDLLKSENDRLADERRQLKQRVDNLLKMAKSLGTAFRE